MRSPQRAPPLARGGAVVIMLCDGGVVRRIHVTEAPVIGRGQKAVI